MPQPTYSTPDNNIIVSKKRKNYIIVLVAMVIIFLIIFRWAPKDFLEKYLTNYVVLISFLIIITLAFLVSMISFYSYSIKHDDFDFLKSGKTAPIEIFKMVSVGFLGFFSSGAFIYFILWAVGAIHHDSSTSTTTTATQYFIQIAIVIVALGFVYKVLTMTNLVNRNLYLKLFISILLYIPCLLVNLIEFITIEGLRFYYSTSRTLMIIMGLEVVLIAVYFLYPIVKSWLYTHYYASNGKQLINYPAPTNQEYSLASYAQLNGLNDKGNDNYAYNYCISFWFYIDSMPPSINASYSKFTSLLSYGGKPNVLFNPSLNTLMITVDQDSIKQMNAQIAEDIANNKDPYHKVREPTFIDVDDNGNRIVYKNEQVLLQKWNNVIMNYSGGTLDIFYNGKLAQSSIEVVPYITLDTLTVGTDNGISGGIANLYYYTNALRIDQITNLYNSVKDQKMPVMPNNDDTYTFKPK
uniref:Uncharacterized protein n=1 Tax=viral metagenome TaxID=1070528 RepID=A0A6C0F5I7_9ZZZZ